MAVKIARALLNKERDIPIGFGISFRFAPFGYADYKEAEAWAHRSARDGLTTDQQAALAGMEIDELDAEFHDRLAALAKEMLLDRLVLQFCKGWDGIEVYEGDDKDDSAPLPYSVKNWALVKEALPMLIDQLFARLQNPMQMVHLEGNGSAPSPNS